MLNQKARILQFKRVQSFDERLDELFMENPIAFFRLIEFCYKPYAVILEKQVLVLLKAKGFVEPDNVVPTAVRAEIKNRFNVAWF